MKRVFTNATGNSKWHDEANWVDREIPRDGDDLYIKDGATLASTDATVMLTSVHIGKGSTLSVHYSHGEPVYIEGVRHDPPTLGRL